MTTKCWSRVFGLLLPTKPTSSLYSFSSILGLKAPSIVRGGSLPHTYRRASQRAWHPRNPAVPASSTSPVRSSTATAYTLRARSGEMKPSRTSRATF